MSGNCWTVFRGFQHFSTSWWMYTEDPKVTLCQLAESLSFIQNDGHALIYDQEDTGDWRTWGLSWHPGVWWRGYLGGREMFQKGSLGSDDSACWIIPEASNWMQLEYRALIHESLSSHPSLIKVVHSNFRAPNLDPFPAARHLGPTRRAKCVFAWTEGSRGRATWRSKRTGWRFQILSGTQT